MDSVRENLSSCSLWLCLLLTVLGLSDSAPQCPRRLDCALRRRNPCPSGSLDCGPCLPHYQEDEERKCVLTGHQQHEMHSELHLIPAYTRGNNTSLPNSGPSQHTEEPQTTVRTTVKTTTESGIGPDREPKGSSGLLNDVVSMSLVIICTVTALFGLLVAGLCWYRLQEAVRRAQKMAYEGNKQPLPQPVDWKIVEKLQKHHYQHQKKVLQALEEGKSEARMKQMSTESETENEDGEYTVYECPGLAPTGEMEIHNPLFDNSILRGSLFDKQD